MNILKKVSRGFINTLAVMGLLVGLAVMLLALQPQLGIYLEKLGAN